ncbi:GNAT family N-acetyltransferase [Myroides sp. LoEW2-1]|uniref:GNAT family N-acetyltransferase n=1 Tax=Myroides sp. LoEW2-1 TaxID=2683192 RepID=UPI001325CEEE|nr:GNAT family N-acetyltransferase [Myroides sp. LoEW2-1]MVX36329.1 GNAT family N-acetyltransferase [Myroides sp. LoEW2-1]
MKRLYFRPLVIEDKEQLLYIYSDKEAMKHRASKPLETLEDAENMVKQAHREWESKTKVRLAVVQQENDVLIGTAMYFFESPTVVEIGFSIGKDFWKYGYGQEGTEGLMEYIKANEPNVNTIVGIARSANDKSIKMMQNIGFTEIMDYDGEDKRRFEFIVNG